jgi:hypothetical protein
MGNRWAAPGVLIEGVGAFRIRGAKLSNRKPPTLPHLMCVMCGSGAPLRQCLQELAESPA